MAIRQRRVLPQVRRTKTGRDCESRPNAPPTWGRFDMKNIAQPTNEIKQVTKNTSILTLAKSAKGRKERGAAEGTAMLFVVMIGDPPSGVVGDRNVPPPLTPVPAKPDPFAFSACFARVSSLMLEGKKPQRYCRSAFIPKPR